MKLKDVRKHRKLLIAMFLAFFICFFLIQNYFFIQHDSKPSYTDGHIIRAAKYYDFLTLKNFQELSMIEYPPFPYLVTQVFFTFGGLSLESARISILFFTLIFLLAMFGIGYELGGSYAGAVVLSIAASSSHILDYSRQYYPDFPQTAITALAFYLLLKTDFFRNRRFSIFFGTVLALSFLTKWSTGFFMIVPVLWYFFPVAIKWNKDKKGSLIFLILAIIAGGGTIWYYWNINPGDKLLTNRWIIFYSLFVLIPGVISTLLIYFIEKKKKDYYSDPDNACINNFTLMSVAFSSLTGLWYYYAGETVKMKFFMLTLDTVVFQGQQYEVTSFFRSIFNVFPFWHILAIVGLVLIFVYRNDHFYRNLLLPANLIIVTLLMLKITCPGSRYLLSIIIFASALAGYWISRTKKFRTFITLVIVIISMVSIASWAVIPPELPSFIYSASSKIISISDPGSIDGNNTPITLFRAAYPIPDNYREPGEEAIRSLFSGKSPCNRLLILFFREFDNDVFPHEFFQFEIFRITGKIQTDFDWSADEFLSSADDKWRSSTPLLGQGDFKDKLAETLKKGNDRFSVYLRKNLSAASLEIIKNCSPGSRLEPDSRKILTEDLNRLIMTRNFLKDREIVNQGERNEIYDRLQMRSTRTSVYILNRKLLDQQYAEEIIRKYEPNPRLDWACNNIDGVVILHDSQQKTHRIESHIKSFFPDRKLEVRSYNLGEIFWATTIKFK